MTSLSRRDAREKLERIVNDSLEQAEKLQSALRDERMALGANDAAALAVAAEAKVDPVHELSVLEDRRSAASRQAGFDEEPTAMHAVIDWCDDAGALSHGWNRLIELARDCEQRNSTNGAIVRARRQQIMAGLAILAGSEFGPDTYQPSGIEDNPRGGRALAQV